MSLFLTLYNADASDKLGFLGYHMLIKSFLCFVIFISSIQNSFALPNLLASSTKPTAVEGKPTIKQPQISKFQLPPNIVYRVDTRPLESLIKGGGFRTWASFNPRNFDDNLANHVGGVSISYRRSNFVTFFAKFEDAIRYTTAMRAKEGIDYVARYIYKIRPNTHFYNAIASLRTVRDTPGMSYVIQDNLNSLLEDLRPYTPFLSYGSVGADRIISVSAALTDNLFRTYGTGTNSPLFDPALASYLWRANPVYNSAYDNDRASTATFANIVPVSMSSLPILNDTILDVLPGASCYGIGYASLLFPNLVPCSDKEHLNFVTVPNGVGSKMAMLIGSQFVITTP